MAQVFEPCDAWWRGFGIIPDSGLRLKEEFRIHDAERFVPQSESKSHTEDKYCLCGEILRGNKVPPDCSLFGRDCIPDHPVGACMVSMEGSCNTWFRYRLDE